MALKVYQLKRLTYLSTYAMVDGKPVSVVFTGGTTNNPTKVTAKYSTTNPKIQKEIESRADFGREITIYYEEKEHEAPRPNIEIPDGFNEVKGVTTAVEAKEYILEKYPQVKHAELRNTSMIKEWAKRNKIVFSELA